jgi:ubiquinone/menaquinone biosynthesis C-methylase UbiE
MKYNFNNFFSPWAKLLVFICIILIVIGFFKNKKKYNVEGFQQTEDFILKEGLELYDPFYVDVYDHLVYSQAKDLYEIGNIVNETNPTSESIILDVGSGTGHHVNILKQKGYNNVTGVDISPHMISKAKENYPDCNFTQGDALNAQQFKPNSFTHILCMYFSLYYFQNKEKFFSNAMKWLKPGGYLVVHIVDREQFDPILPPGNPLLLVSPQRYAKERITKTSVIFNDMEYVANFDLDKNENIATFDEKFTHKDSGKVRKNKHTLHMETTKQILVKVQNAGFIYHGQIDLIKSGYEYQYLYIFIKPN